MPDDKTCRVCLISDVKMFAADEYQLKQFYEEITMKKMNPDTGPQHFCFLCAALINKYHKFKEKCLIVEDTLNELLKKGPIKPSTITEEYRKDKNLGTPIGIINANKNTKTCIMKQKYLKTNKQPEIETIVDLEPKETDSKEVDFKEIDSKPVEIKVDLEETQINIADIENSLKIEESNLDSLMVQYDSEGTLSDVEQHSDNELLSNLSKTQTEEVKDENESTNSNQQEEEEKEEEEKEEFKKSKIKDKKLKNNSDSAKKSRKAFVRKPKRFERALKGPFMDSQHWEKINMSEVEAEEYHQAKQNDPKYITAVYKCTGCFKCFSKEEMYIRHKKARHDESLGLECRFCGMRFKRKWQVSKHMSQHYTIYKCLRCDLVCPLETTAQFHDEYHNGVIRTCSDCGKEFRHLSSFYTHLRTHRSQHVCTLCGASFVSDMGLNLHKLRKHITDLNVPQERIHCSKCDIMFETKEAYDEHFIHSAMHAEGFNAVEPAPFKRGRNTKRLCKKPSHCAICDKSFATQAQYFTHHAAEHSHQPRNNQEKVVCEICGQTLAFHSMKSHLNTHTREHVFSCSICGVEMITKTSLNRHKLTHTGAKPYKCPLCDKHFTQKGSMKLHYRTYHLKEPYPKRNRKKDTDEIGLFDDFGNHVEPVSSNKRNRWR